MPRPVPLPVRQKLWDRAQRGESVRSLAEAFQLPERTVRALCRRFRLRGARATEPDYHPPAVCPHAKPLDWRQDICRLRRDHPSWGAGLILVVLRERFPDRAWPSERTAQRWLQRAGLNPAPAGRRPRSNPLRAQRPHEVWQMDAAEVVRLADGTSVCWLRLVDEFTGAALRTTVFPPEPLGPGRRTARAS
jgi:hypothetical protein